MSGLDIGTLAEEVVRRLTVEMEASGRHVHLSRAGVEQLFGAGYRLNRVRDLSQPGQFVCAERVTLEGPRGALPNVVVLGPERPECQAEVSLTDAVALGLQPPVRLSGDIASVRETSAWHSGRSGPRTTTLESVPLGPSRVTRSAQTNCPGWERSRTRLSR